MFMYPKGRAEEAGPLPSLKLRLGPKVCSPAVALTGHSPTPHPDETSLWRAPRRLSLRAAFGQVRDGWGVSRACC